MPKQKLKKKQLTAIKHVTKKVIRGSTLYHLFLEKE